MSAIKVSREEWLRHNGWGETPFGWVNLRGTSAALPMDIAYELQTVIDTALAAATGTAKTPKAVECEASPSGPKGNAQQVQHD